MSSATVEEAIYAALVADAGITPLLGTYKGHPSIHTIWPAPDDAGQPMILISDPTGSYDQDAIVSRRPVEMRQISIYGANPTHYRAVQQLGRLLRKKLHRQKFAISITGVQVLDIVCTGPVRAPTSRPETCGVVVPATIRMRETA